MLKTLLMAFLVLQATWTVTNVTDITIVPADFPMPDGSMTLSPDGTMAAWGSRMDGLCIYTLADGQGNCREWPVPNIRLDRYARLAWSPDSTKLAFTPNFFVMFNEPDIWVYNLTDGFFTNRTEDDALKFNIGENNNTQLDYAPVWGMDGELYFFRSSDATDEYSLELYRLLPDSDTPELVGDYSNKFPPLSVYVPPAISPDGTQMAVIVQDVSRDDLRSGVWVIDLEDGSADTAVNTLALHEGFPEWQEVEGVLPQSVAWAGDNALIVMAGDLGRFGGNVGQNYHYIDLETKRVTPLVDLTVIETQVDAFNIGEDGHSGIYLMPRLGIVTSDAFIYAHFDLTSEEAVSLSVIPLPPDGSEPVLIDELEGCDIRRLMGDPLYLSVLTPANNAAVYNCVITFEQGA